MRLLLPFVLAVSGAGAGVGAGLYLRPAPPETAAPDGTVEVAPAAQAPRPPIDQTEFTKLNSQFVVPVLDDGQTRAMVVMSLSLETVQGARETVFAREPKLRDAFLRVLFDHANAGSFDDTFTANDRLGVLRRNLREAARPILGDDLIDVLVTELARQDG